MSCCINRRKPVPERTDRGGTLRYAWLRAPPLLRMQKITSKPRSGCLTPKPSYEGGQSEACPPPPKSLASMVGTLRFAHPTNLRFKIFPHFRKHVAKHLRRQHPRVGVVARAMIGVVEPETAGLVHRAVRERRRGIAQAQRLQRRIVGDPAGISAMPAIRNCRQVLISIGNGLFCGGRQCTALPIRQSTSLSPSSGRA